MSERKWVAANGQEITEEMIGRWCDAYERGEFPEGERTVGGVVHGRPPTLDRGDGGHLDQGTDRHEAGDRAQSQERRHEHERVCPRGVGRQAAWGRIGKRCGCMVRDDRAVTVSVELSGETARVVSEQAARAGVGLGEYVRGLVAEEVERRRPWRFEIEFDEGKAVPHGTTADELYDRVGAFVEPYGNVRVARGTWQVYEGRRRVQGTASGAGAPGAGALGHAERQGHNVLRERHRW